MTTYLVTRHPGAWTWAAQEGIPIDRVVEHLDPEVIQPGDCVIGTLPVNLVAEVCERGGRYFHLSLRLTRQSRGQELTPELMRAYGARIMEYRVMLVTSTETAPSHPESAMPDNPTGDNTK